MAADSSTPLWQYVLDHVDRADPKGLAVAIAADGGDPAYRAALTRWNKLRDGQNRDAIAGISLLLAEAEVIAEQRRTPPLVLLDDVLSELDASRRRILAERIGRVGQAVVTATGADALPLEPAQLLEVTPGVVSSR